jgi:hypothetical protein
MEITNKKANTIIIIFGFVRIDIKGTDFRKICVCHRGKTRKTPVTPIHEIMNMT